MSIHNGTASFRLLVPAYHISAEEDGSVKTVRSMLPVPDINEHVHRFHMDRMRGLPCVTFSPHDPESSRHPLHFGEVVFHSWPLTELPRIVMTMDCTSAADRIVKLRLELSDFPIEIDDPLGPVRIHHLVDGAYELLARCRVPRTAERRRGNPTDVQERPLDPNRSGNPTDIQEQRLRTERRARRKPKAQEPAVDPFTGEMNEWAVAGDDW